MCSDLLSPGCISPHHALSNQNQLSAHSYAVRLHVGKNKCWLMLRSLYLWWIRTPVPSRVARSVGYDHNHHHPHLRMFLFPVVCHSPQVLESPPQTGSYNPPLGPLRFEEGGLYLRTGKKKQSLRSQPTKGEIRFFFFPWCQNKLHVLLSLISHGKPIISVNMLSTSQNSFSFLRWWPITGRISKAGYERVLKSRGCDCNSVTVEWRRWTLCQEIKSNLAS